MDPDVFYSTGQNSCGFIPEAQSIIDEVDRDLIESIEMGSENAAPTPISLAPFDAYVSSRLRPSPDRASMHANIDNL